MKRSCLIIIFLGVLLVIGGSLTACSDEQQENVTGIEEKTLIGEWIFDGSEMAEEVVSRIDGNNEDYICFNSNRTLSITSYDDTGEVVVYTYGYTLNGDILRLEYQSEFANYFCQYVYMVKRLDAESLSLHLDKRIEDGKGIEIRDGKGPLVQCFKRRKSVKN